MPYRVQRYVFILYCCMYKYIYGRIYLYSYDVTGVADNLPRCLHLGYSGRATALLYGGCGTSGVACTSSTVHGTTDSSSSADLYDSAIVPQTWKSKQPSLQQQCSVLGLRIFNLCQGTAAVMSLQSFDTALYQCSSTGIRHAIYEVQAV